MEKQNSLDNLQRKSYIKDQSVIEPGQEPMPPLYGNTRELMFKVSNHMPTVFGQRLTLTDIAQLHEENQHLRNKVLDRQTICQICGEDFENFQIDEIAEHHKEHRETLQQDGQCPWCADTNYGFMTMEQKRFHLKQHFDREDTITKKNFWKDHRCPLCDEDFTRWKPEEIIDHCLNSHAPGLVQFCDKCGANTGSFNAAEAAYHKRSCRDRPEGLGGDKEPEFCTRCGKNVSHQGPEEAKLHSRDCLQQKPKDHFCDRCGFKLSSKSGPEISIHKEYCRAPGGPKRQFCRQCGKNLAKLAKNPAALAAHKRNCFEKDDHNVKFVSLQRKIAGKSHFQDEEAARLASARHSKVLQHVSTRWYRANDWLLYRIATPTGQRADQRNYQQRPRSKLPGPHPRLREGRKGRGNPPP